MIALILLACFGVSWIVGFSTITLPIRKWLGGFQREVRMTRRDGTVVGSVEKVPGHLWYLGSFICKLVECPGCFSFHMGWIYELILGPTGLTGPRWFAVITMGAAFAASSFILGRLTRIIE